MRFVTPESVRIQLKDSIEEDGTVIKNWIEVKKELNVDEAKDYRSAGMKDVTPSEGGPSRVGIDWKAMALARVHTYLTDWSAAYRNDNGQKPTALSKDAIGALPEEDFDEIDAAIQAHITAQQEEKKRKNGSPKPTEISP